MNLPALPLSLMYGPSMLGETHCSINLNVLQKNNVYTKIMSILFGKIYREGIHKGVEKSQSTYSSNDEHAVCIA